MEFALPENVEAVGNDQATPRVCPFCHCQEPLAVSVKEAVRLSGWSRSVIFEMLRAGKLRRGKQGRRTTISMNDLRKAIEECFERKGADA